MLVPNLFFQKKKAYELQQITLTETERDITYVLTLSNGSILTTPLLSILFISMKKMHQYDMFHLHSMKKWFERYFVVPAVGQSPIHTPTHMIHDVHHSNIMSSNDSTSSTS